MGAPQRFPQAFFFDLDGTLLAPGSILTAATAAAVRRCANRGATVVLATGGFSARALVLARLLDGGGPARTWAITHNGAAIWDPTGRLVCSDTMPAAALRTTLAAAGTRVWAAFETARADGTTQMYYAGRLRREMLQFVWGPHDAGAERTGPDGAHGGAPGGAPGGGRALADALSDPAPPRGAPAGSVAVGAVPRWDWRGARRAARGDQANVLGCWCIGTPEALAPLDGQAERGALGGARYLRWSARLSHILNRPRLRLEGRDIGPLNAHKGAAAAWVCDYLGLDMGRSAAFGDADNDLQVLRLAGTAVAMPHAAPEVLAAAGRIAPPYDEDGVAQVLNEWLELPD